MNKNQKNSRNDKDWGSDTNIEKFFKTLDEEKTRQQQSDLNRMIEIIENGEHKEQKNFSR